MKNCILSLAILAFLTSCLPSMNKTALNFKEHAKPDFRTVTEEDVTFDELKTKVLEPKCLSCHAKWKDEVAFQARYIRPGNPEESRLYESVRLARMPKGKPLEDGTREAVVPLSSEELDLIYNYILNATPASENTLVTFDELKTKVLEPKCIGCHRKMGDEAAFIKSYVVAGDPENSKAYASVVKRRMPKSRKLEDGTIPPVVPLSGTEILLLKNYIKNLTPQ